MDKKGEEGVKIYLGGVGLIQESNWVGVKTKMKKISMISNKILSLSNSSVENLYS